MFQSGRQNYLQTVRADPRGALGELVETLAQSLGIATNLFHRGLITSQEGRYKQEVYPQTHSRHVKLLKLIKQNISSTWKHCTIAPKPSPWDLIAIPVLRGWGVWGKYPVKLGLGKLVPLIRRHWLILSSDIGAWTVLPTSFLCLEGESPD